MIGRRDTVSLLIGSYNIKHSYFQCSYLHSRSPPGILLACGFDRFTYTLQQSVLGWATQPICSYADFPTITTGATVKPHIWTLHRYPIFNVQLINLTTCLHFDLFHLLKQAKRSSQKVNTVHLEAALPEVWEKHFITNQSDFFGQLKQKLA